MVIFKLKHALHYVRNKIQTSTLLSENNQSGVMWVTITTPTTCLKYFYSFFSSKFYTIWSLANSHPPTSSSLSYGSYNPRDWRVAHASSKTSAVRKPHLFKLLFHIHALTDVYDWLVIVIDKRESMASLTPLSWGHGWLWPCRELNTWSPDDRANTFLLQNHFIPCI